MNRNDENKNDMHTFNLPNSRCDPKGTKLLSPQHWAKELKRQAKQPSSVKHSGDDKSTTLQWEGHHKTCGHKEQGQVSDSNTTVNNVEIDQGGHLKAREACMEMPKSKTMHDCQQQDSGTKLCKSDEEVFPTENKMMMSMNNA